jgi:uncharacterized membrane protein HdeD (DUF308 family)
MSIFFSPPSPPEFSVEQLRQKWGLLAGFGIALIVLGALMLFSFTVAVIGAWAIAIVFGVLLLLAGIVQIAEAFMVRHWGGFFLLLITGALDIVIALFFFLFDPGRGVDILAFLLAAYFIFGGLIRILSAILRRFPHRIWLFVSGAIALILGVFVMVGLFKYADTLFSELVLGTYIGANMLFNGVSLLMLGLAARKAVTPAV